MLKQRTLKLPVKASGVGLHGGAKVTMVLRPAAVDTGIIFRRVDLDPIVEIPATASAVCDTRLCTAIGNEGVRVSTVEHLMAALSGLGIDNALIDLDAAEVPILDGSAAPFIFLIQSVGIEEQAAIKKFIRVKQAVEVCDGDRWARLDVYDGYRVVFGIVFNHPTIDRTAQEIMIDFAQNSFVHEIARARTFGFMQDVEFLHETGLAMGGGLDNAVVLDEYRILNSDGLRYPDEFVKHKALDAIGDLYMLGRPLLASFSAFKSGHALNNKLARQLLADQNAWELVSFDQAVPPPAAVEQWFQLTGLQTA